MQGLNNEGKVDSSLLEQFQREIWSKVPHLEGKASEAKVVNATPLKDITEHLKECARSVFNTDIADKNLRVFGKFESQVLGGSIKSRDRKSVV